jgi:PKD repeat protein
MSSGTPTSWAWVFPGGTPGTSNVQNPTGIIYDQPGNHDVTLTVSKATGDPASTTKTAYIAVTSMPLADFADVTGCPGLPVNFTDQTNPSGGTITNWNWNFGDPNSGSSNTSIAQNPAHTFNDPGTYQVSLEVITNGVCTNVKLKDIVINTTPAAAAKPEGEVSLCKNSADKLYTTTGATGATAYTWLVEPDVAGTIAGTGTTGTLTLIAGFTGSLTIKVQGMNDCGNGVYSEELPVTVIEAPAAPVKPTGIDSVNVNKVLTSEFTTTEVPGAVTYAWSILPANAGTISGTTLTGTVTWNTAFRGDVVLDVKAVNACGESVASEGKAVKVYAPVGMAENDGFNLEIFPNPNNGKFALDIATAVASKVNLTMYNALGVVVYAENDVKINGKLHKTLDLTNLAKGVYRLKVEGNGLSNTISVVIGK